MYSVYAIARSDEQAIRIGQRLRSSGFSASDISFLYPDRTGTGELGHENATKSPEGAVIGASSGAILGGALGWLVGVGSLAIPGLGPLIAAGPILAALSGVAAGGTLGGLAGGLAGLGIPEYEAQRYEGRLREGNILVSIHVEDTEEASRARTILTEEGAEDISTGSEAAVPDRRT